jgi:hypothetical protein
MSASGSAAGRTRIVFLAFVFLIPAGMARAAVVYLKEGGRLEGVLVSSTDAEIVLDTSQGRVRVEMNRVRNVDYAQAAAPAAPAAASPLPPEDADRFYRRRMFVPAASIPFDERRQMLSLDFGLASPQSGIHFSGTAGGGSASNGDVGTAFGFQYLYFSSPRVGWGIEYHYYERGVAESQSLLPLSDSHVFGDTSLLLAVAKFSLTDGGPVRPFLLVGAGGHVSSTVVDSRPLQGYSWSDTQTNETRRLIDGGGAGLAASVRLGVDFGFIDPSVFSMEAGWTGLTSVSYQATTQGSALGISGASGPLNYFTLTGRWGLSF